MRPSLVLAATAGLAACVNSPSPAEPYAFVGRWDCGGATFTFTNTTWNTGRETYAIRSVVQDGNSYTLFMADGFRIGLGLVTQTGLTWVSGRTGDQINCRRV